MRKRGERDEQEEGEGRTGLEGGVEEGWRDG